MSKPVWIDWEKGERVRIHKQEGRVMGGEQSGETTYVSSYLEVGDTGTVISNGVDSDEEVYVAWDKYHESEPTHRLYIHFTLIEPVPTLHERPETPDEIERFLMQHE